MALELVAVTFDALDASAVAAFWGALLARTAVPDRGGFLLPGDDTQVGLRFLQADTRKIGPNRLHLHLTSASGADQQATVERALALGGRHLDVGQLPEEHHVVLADPGGNEFCVIEPGNNFLAECGSLAEVTCDGSRDVGMFWRDALGWPLVWDRDKQTAIQSPRGGTKLSWDSWDDAPVPAPNRQRFDLASEDPTTQAQRLATLGARLLGRRGDSITLADPDGREFSIRQS